MDHAISLVNVSVMKATPVSSATAVQMVTTGFLIAEVSQIRVRPDNTQNSLLIHSAWFYRLSILSEISA